MEYALALMMGWCGTKWPGWRPFPPGPQPDPWNILGGIAGAVGGGIAWAVFGAHFGAGGLVPIGVISFFGGNFLGSLVNDLRDMGSRNG